LSENKLTIILSEDDEYKCKMAFIIASTGASLGKEVNMFFAFNGANFLKKEFKRDKFIERLMNECIEMNVKFFICSATIDMLGLKRDEFLEFVEFSGAMGLISAIDRSKVIFI